MRIRAKPVSNEALRSLKVLRDFFELIHWSPLRPGSGAHGFLKAVVDVVVDKCFLGRIERFFDCMKLLGDIKTASLGLHHFNDGAKMPFGALQPFDNVRVGAVYRQVFHHVMASPWRGSF